MAVTVRANPSTQQTNTNLLPALENRQISVSGVFISSDTALTVTIVNSESHSVLLRQYVGKDGGLVLPIHFLSARHEGLDYTTSAAGNVFIIVWYDIVGRVVE